MVKFICAFKFLLCATAILPLVFGSINPSTNPLVGVGVLEQQVYLITKRLEVYRVAGDTLPDRLVTGHSSSSLESVWPGLAKSDLVDKCASDSGDSSGSGTKQQCKIWFYSDEGNRQDDSVFYSIQDGSNQSVRYQVNGERLQQPQLVSVPFDPWSDELSSSVVMLSTDQVQAQTGGTVYRVSAQYGGLLFESVPIIGGRAGRPEEEQGAAMNGSSTTLTPSTTTDNTTLSNDVNGSMPQLFPNDSRLLCFYPSDGRVQFSQDLFGTDCGVPVQWSPRTGFLSAWVFYVFGNDSNVYIFSTGKESGIGGESEYVLRVIPDYEFLSLGVSTAVKVLIALGVLVLVGILSCCLFRWVKKRQANQKAKAQTATGTMMGQQSGITSPPPQAGETGFVMVQMAGTPENNPTATATAASNTKRQRNTKPMTKKRSRRSSKRSGGRTSRVKRSTNNNKTGTRTKTSGATKNGQKKRTKGKSIRSGGKRPKSGGSARPKRSSRQVQVKLAKKSIKGQSTKSAARRRSGGPRTGTSRVKVKQGRSTTLKRTLKCTNR